MIAAAQSRGGRAMLKWTVAELSRRAEVAPNTITRFEADKSVNTGTVVAIQRALEAAGVEFLPDNGVRLRTLDQAAESVPPRRATRAKA
jgi:transcriptional regulator with XRE-family HTH domain